MSKLAHLKKKAADFEQKRLFEKALSVYEEILQEQGGGEETDIALLNRVGDLYLRQGAVEPALRLYEQAVDLYADRGFLNNAIALCNKILRQDPRRAEIHLRLGRVSARNGFRADARRHFLEYASQLDRVGGMEQALDVLRSMADEGPEFEDVRYMVADMYVARGRVEEAVAQLRIAHERMASEGRHADAQAALSRILELDPEFRMDDRVTPARGIEPDSGGLEHGSRSSLHGGPNGRGPSGPELILFEPTDVTAPATHDLAVEPPENAPDAAAELAANLDMSADPGPRTAAERLGASLGDQVEMIVMPDGLIRGAELDPPGAGNTRVRSLTPLDLEPMLEIGIGMDDELPKTAPMEGMLPTIEEAAATPPEPAGLFFPEEILTSADPVVTGTLDVSTDVDVGSEIATAAEFELEWTASTDEHEPSAAGQLDTVTPASGSGEDESTGGGALDLDWIEPFPESSDSSGDVQHGPELVEDDGGLIFMSPDPEESDRGEDDALAATRLDGQPIGIDSLDVGSIELDTPTVGPLDGGPISIGSMELGPVEIGSMDGPSIGELSLSEDLPVLEDISGAEGAPVSDDILVVEERPVAEGVQVAGNVPFVDHVPVPDAAADIELIRSVDASMDRGEESVPAAGQPVVGPAPEPPLEVVSDSYVNLGDWLRDDDEPRSTRMVTEERAPSGDEQADFVEMLRKFKQGVADNVDENDHASYYDLGIAYREMGLLDEAIASLQKALRGTRERVRAFEALGQCFLDRGQPSVASSVLQRALHEPAVDDERLVGVLYLLGRAAEAQNQRTEALGYYQRVFAIDIEFGDVAERIGVVEQVPS